MKVWLLKIRFFLSLLTWQTSLVIASVAALALSGIVVVASPGQANNQNIPREPGDQPAFSGFTTIKFNSKLEDINLFVYDKLAEDPDTPININLKFDEEDNAFIELYPGFYNITFVREGFELVEKDVVIETSKDTILFNLNFGEESPDSSDNDNSNNSGDGEIDFSEQKRPDLVVTSLKFFNGGEEVTNIDEGENLRLLVELENRGNETAGGFVYSFRIRKDSGGWESFFVGSYKRELEPGENGSVDYTWSVPSNLGIKDIQFVADSTFLVNESDEENNTRLAQLSISRQAVDNRYDFGITNLSVNDEDGETLFDRPIPANTRFDLEMTLSNSSVSEFSGEIDLEIVFVGVNDTSTSNLITRNLSLPPSELVIVNQGFTSNVAVKEIIVRVDPGNKLEEQSEENNEHRIVR